MATATHQGIPPLVNGDRLSREEFERRYDAMPGLKKAELIEGVVYMPSSAAISQHAVPRFDVLGCLGVYRWATPGVEGAAHGCVRLDLANMLQPDACLFIDPDKGGQARISDDDYLEDAPELVAEVAASGASYDLTFKFDVYRRHKVREYVVWRVRDHQIDWFVLRGKRFVRLPLDKSGLYKSNVFPGLWLDPAALIRGDNAALQAALQRGLASREHANFVARLNARSNP
jgi:Uma2 family endonuclease